MTFTSTVQVVQHTCGSDVSCSLRVSALLVRNLTALLAVAGDAGDTHEAVRRCLRDFKQKFRSEFAVSSRSFSIIHLPLLLEYPISWCSAVYAHMPPHSWHMPSALDPQP